MKNKAGFIKKTSLIALAALSLQVSAPQRSSALVGLLGPYGLPVKVIIFLTGGLVASYGEDLQSKKGDVSSAFLLLSGLIMMDSQGGNSLELMALSDATAEKAGVTPPERDSYNGQIEEVRAIHQSIASASISDGKIDYEKAKNLWEQYKTQISPETLSALTKVSRELAKSLN